MYWIETLWLPLHQGPRSQTLLISQPEKASIPDSNY